MLASGELHGGHTGSRMSSNSDQRQSEAADVAVSSQQSCIDNFDNPVIAEHLEAVHDLCREFGVARLEVVGSVCTPDFDPGRSDVDFIVDYPPDYDFGPWLTRFFALQEALANLLSRKVDLVMKSAMQKKYFILSAIETRHVLYAV
jgi:uncharacterized protein